MNISVIQSFLLLFCFFFASFLIYFLICYHLIIINRTLFFLWYFRKAIQGEIKISTEDGETRTLRSAPDWGVSWLFLFAYYIKLRVNCICSTLLGDCYQWWSLMGIHKRFWRSLLRWRKWMLSNIIWPL